MLVSLRECTRRMAEKSPGRRLQQLKGVLNPIQELRSTSYTTGSSDHTIAREPAGRGIENDKNVQGSHDVIKEGVTLLSMCVQGERGIIDIGGVKVPVNRPTNPELVPRLYVKEKLSQSTLHHLKWMLSKDLIGQDMFLIGPPGPLSRHLSLTFSELVSREVEYVSLSRDTTEVDLKQRKEIVNNTVSYIDQAVVSAAVKGRVLILEGLEKAERNVLPILNNLLENREAQLDDGRFIMSHDRYDKLAKDYSLDQLDKWQLVRASEKFRVIALGLPVPPYHGNTIDPPLRSRFQSRHILPPPFPEVLEELKASHPTIPLDKLSSITSVVYTLHSLTLGQSGGPINLTGQLSYIIDILSMNPSTDLYGLLYSIFPADLLGAEQLFKNTLEKFDIRSSDNQLSQLTCIPLAGNTDHLQVSFKQLTAPVSQFNVMGYPDSVNITDTTNYVPLPRHQSLLSLMLQSHLVGDICLVGPKGSGKTTLMSQFAKLLGYTVEPIVLYQDMTSRDLLQQRTTTANGDTGWRLTPLVTAALNGHLAVLDGIHRLDVSTISTIKRLIQDRELNLTDGTRLLSESHFTAAMEAAGMTKQEMIDRKIFPVHPKFRIVAIGEPVSHTVSPSATNWLSPEVVSMFQFTHLTPLPKNEEKQLIVGKVPSLSAVTLDKLLDFTHFLRTSDDPIMLSLSSSLSTRQLIRIAMRLSRFPEDTLYETILRSCLSRFLPAVAKATLLRGLSKFNIQPATKKLLNDAQYQIHEGFLQIGNTQVPRYSNHSDIALVPNVIFYDNPQHLHLLEEILKDYSLGEHILLIGNQGVGKNKLVDRFLNLLNAPREYLQLHRDSTVQTLTTQPSVIDGRIVYQDSPLVSAVQYGRILIVDEADKAPTHVTAILRNIVSGETITLSDGRKISPHSQINERNSTNIIPVHKNFRMFVLANRPGFPFLGNDFYAAVGDCFSCHSVDNPDFLSEMSMVCQYGPGVPEDILKKLVSAFAELREMADEGKISYPYSTREVVNIVRHLQNFPDEGIANVVRNVFDFDSYSPHLLDTVLSTLHRHGIPVGANRNNVRLAVKEKIPSLKLSSKLSVDVRESCSVQSTQVSDPFKLPVQLLPCERDVTRSRLFSEVKCQWFVPLHDSNHISSICHASDMSPVLHMVTANLPSLYSLDITTDKLSYIDLFDYLPSGRGSSQPHTSVHVIASGVHKGKVLIHEGHTNLLYLFNPCESTLSRVIFQSDSKLLGAWRGRKKEELFVLTPCDSSCNSYLIYQKGGNTLKFLGLSDATPLCNSLTLPCSIQTVLPLSSSHLLVSDANEKLYLLNKSDSHSTLSPIIGSFQDTLLSLSSSYISKDICNSLNINFNDKDEVVRFALSKNSPVALLKSNQLVSNMELYELPLQDSQFNDIGYLPNEGTVVTTSVDNNMSVFNLPNSTQWKLQLPEKKKSLSSLPQSNVQLMVTPASTDSVLTVSGKGEVSLVEVGHFALQQSLNEWYKMVGESNDGKQLTLSRDSGLSLSSPKHGKVDPHNAPHVGGNTWAGGTGGRDTAGLGGKGGPYRLDAGHNVFQISDEEKMAVPEEVKQAARELGQKALKERLKEIAMSEPDHKLYTELRNRVDKQVQMLRAILESSESKSTERQWLRHQTTGDLDDRKLVDGLTGEKAIYKKRGERDPEISQYPKCIRLVVDVSGSMYRFNGYDGRLDRTMEAVLMVIEAFETHRQKFKLDIVGHSGDEIAIPFLTSENPPCNEKEKMMILKAMHAHSQFCWTGDNTVDATTDAINTIASEPADECYVIVLSDANFSRYYIDPIKYGKLMTSDPRIKVFAIFIGSLGDEANRLQEAIPAGRSFICFNNHDLPLILRQILSSSVL